ncbi:MAG: hypothetical protein Q8Q09_06885 [Deltaproteobacteria bacterium]|nr:hypothetical protein [Deltaproteobacteria bacterium]
MSHNRHVLDGLVGALDLRVPRLPASLGSRSLHRREVQRFARDEMRDAGAKQRDPVLRALIELLARPTYANATTLITRWDAHCDRDELLCDLLQPELFRLVHSLDRTWRYEIQPLCALDPDGVRVALRRSNARAIDALDARTASTRSAQWTEKIQHLRHSLLTTLSGPSVAASALADALSEIDRVWSAQQQDPFVRATTHLCEIPQVLREELCVPELRGLLYRAQAQHTCDSR